jgi:putative hydrolase
MMLRVCISIGSDAHIKEGICEFDRAYKVIEDTQFPEELIVNSDYSLYESYIGKKN